MPLCDTVVKQQSFEGIIDFIDFIDEQHAALFLLDRFKQWPGHEIRSACDLAFNLAPVRRLGALAHQQDVEFLQVFIVLADGLLFVDALVALEAQKGYTVCPSDRLSQLGLSRAGGAFEHDRAMDLAS